MHRWMEWDCSEQSESTFHAVPNLMVTVAKAGKLFPASLMTEGRPCPLNLPPEILSDLESHCGTLMRWESLLAIAEDYPSLSLAGGSKVELVFSVSLIGARALEKFEVPNVLWHYLCILFKMWCFFIPFQAALALNPMDSWSCRSTSPFTANSNLLLTEWMAVVVGRFIQRLVWPLPYHHGDVSEKHKKVFSLCVFSPGSRL